MAQTYSSKGKVFLTQHQFDSRKDAGTLQNGVEYMIIDDPNTIELSDGSISLLASNGVMIIGKSAEEPYLTIGTGNQVLVDTPQVARQVANKLYVDDGLAKKQDKLSANSPLYIESSGDSSSIGIKCGDGLYVDSSNGLLAVNWGDIPLEENSPLYISCNRLSFSLYEPLCLTSCNSLWLNYGHGLDKFSNSCNQSVLGVACDSSSPLYINDSSKLSLKCSSPLYINSSNDNNLSVNISEIASNIAGDGLYVDGCNSVLSVNWESIPIDANSPIYFGSCNQGLSVNISEIASNIAGSGLSYNSATQKLDADTYTKETYGDFIFPPNQLTTIRAKISDSDDASRIKFNGTYWIELSYCNGYAWGMTSSNGSGDYFTYSALKVNTTTTSNCTIVSTTGDETSCNSTAFVTTTIIK